MKRQVDYISGETAQVLTPEPIPTWVMGTTILSHLGFMLMVAIVMVATNLPGFRVGQLRLHLVVVLDAQGFV